MKPDPETIIARLKDSRQSLASFKQQGPACYRTGGFSNWLSEVNRWLKAGQPYTDDQYSEFFNLRFTPVSQWDRSPDKIWQNSVQRANYLLLAAVENLTNQWVLSDELVQTLPNSSAPSPTIAPVTINNNNANVQWSATSVEATLEAVSKAIEEADASEGKNFKDRLARLAKNPAVKAVLGTAIDALLRHYSS